MARLGRCLAASRKDNSQNIPAGPASARYIYKGYSSDRLRASKARRSLAVAVLAALVCWSDPARAETVAGVTSGALSVDSYGSANYTIPIDVPPGVAGMEPSLSLVYSSRADNGIMGVGWSLGGLSIIHRCPQTIVQDGAKGGIKFDADDRFCLDGQRLVAVSGTYGADGTEYRTEVDTFSRIVSHGTAGSGPEFFTVETKAGQVMEYGGSVDSRVPVAGRSEYRFWALNRVEDTVGNTMTFHYLEDAVNETCRIDRIAYAGNATAGTAPQSEIQFTYEVRPDQRDVYQAGARINMMHRLTGIETYTDAVLVRDYRLAYDASAEALQSRLMSVTECDGAGNCLAPTSFEWTRATDATGGWVSSPELNAPVIVGPDLARFADLNGDGLVDFASNTRAKDGGTASHAYLNTGGGWQETASFELPYWSMAYFNATSTGDVGSHLLDLNGDGLVDFLYRHRDPGNQTEEGAFLNTGSGWQPANQFIPPEFTAIHGKSDSGARFADLDGDGLVDFLYRRNSGTVVSGAYLNTGDGWQSAPEFAPPYDIADHTGSSGKNSGVRVLDLNGDGLSDFLWKRSSGGTSEGAFLNTGQGWEEAPSFVPPYYTGIDGVGDTGTRFIDVNGDGLPDFLYYRQTSGGSVYKGAYLNTGSGWVAASDYELPFYLMRERVPDVLPENNSRMWGSIYYVAAGLEMDPGSRFGDLNGDGLVDFFYHHVDRYETRNSVTTLHSVSKGAYLNTGKGWRSAPEYIPVYPTGFTNYCGWSVVHYAEVFCMRGHGMDVSEDIDGDGVTDFVYGYRPLSVYGYRPLSFLSNGGADLVKTVTDSLGRDTAITYTQLKDPRVYTKGAGAAFPEQDVQGPMYVVQEVATDDGLGGQARTTYSYEGARAHLQGRGFLGFARMTSIDQQTGIETVTDYLRDFPFIGQVAATETRLSDGTLVRRVTDTWTEASLNGGLTAFPHVSRSEAESFEINDGPGNLPVTTITTTSAYDDFGNPTSIIATTTGGGETFRKTATNVYTNDTARWFLGRLTRATVKSELPDLSFETRVSAFDYDPLTGLLRQEVVEPDLPTFTLTTDYGHDVFGNTTSTTVSGGDITTRTTTTEFSIDGRFAVKVTNDLGHVETHAHDPRFGMVTSLTGPNDITTIWAFDGFGRKIREARADGTETRWSHDLCTTQCPPGGVYTIVQQDLNSASLTPIGPRRVEYFDALNRAFRSETESFDGTRIFVDTEFNARGEVVAVTRPYFDGTTASNIQQILTTYDDIGRPRSVTHPDGGVTTSDYDGLTTTSTNALNQTERRWNNAIGQLVEVRDNLGTKVTYRYDPFGNLEETDAGGVVTTMAYDIRGRKISMVDPNMGAWIYDHNALGELVSQTDAENQSVTLEYDTLGRLKRRVEAEGTTEWVYDTAAKGIGKLQSVTAPGDYFKVQGYDNLGRPSATTTTIDGVNYTSSVTYDGAGRLETKVYPSGFAVRNSYNARGYLVSVSEVGGTTVYWRADSDNAEGQVTQETMGNGVVTARAFDPKTGLIDSIGTTMGATVIQDLAYDFDVLGNLKQRADLRQNRQEDFLYDGLNRLLTTTLTDSGAGGGTLATTAYTYDALGNIKTKSDVGTYLYGGAGAGPHAVTEVAGEVYAYDLNGNLTSGGGREITHASFNKPTLIRQIATGDEAGFTYGPDRARIKQRIVENGIAREVIYLGGYERRTRYGSPDELVHYIAASGTVAIHTIYDDNLPATDKARYLHRDHLGSVEAITGETGVVIQRLSFDAHGKRRLADWTAGAPTAPDAETPRGFTGHEHLDSVGLIHMNGRVYDPTLGRFLSADPFVQAPDTTQSFNRYSYVGNNPLSYTDPSGFFFKKIGKFFKKIGKAITRAAKAVWRGVREALQSQWVQLAAQIAIGVFVPPGFNIIAAAAFAGLATVAAGGSLMDAVMAAGITAGTSLAMAGVGKAFGNSVKFLSPKHFLKIAAHGAVGGVSSVARGGKFEHGFAAGAVAEFAAPGIDSIPGKGPDAMVARTAVSAVAGGVSAKLAGGKFQNGAITGAFVRLFNHEKPFEDNDWTENWFKSGEHEYERLSPEVCSTAQSGCTQANVVDALNFDGVHPNQTRPFVPGEEYIGDVDLPGPFGVDHVRSTAIYDTYGAQIGVRNVTLENHLLHFGYVERTVVQNSGSFYILTRGGGSGILGGPNIWLDDLIWEGVDQNVIDEFN